ncbi:acid sugar phosphatase [Alicyclobacillus cellulosilyticus]|uniref:Acid sugar phosphatase n=1 Tax=Alicyclobacillus cellulosilyticus TaxID=1003997 RepID=A0A917KG40_9BACL|nr:HAD-IIA family hydrolase [Alicyclobacillus cellulosilyticus]GGJ09980.1 acid sugar phosphatase [Alicyclobacillus cellulosilyticus]
MTMQTAPVWRGPWRLALLDLDGTLYRGDQVIPGAPAFVARLRAQGIQPVFFTNNASKTPQQVAHKLVALGIEASADEVCTSAQAAAAWIRDEVGPGARVAFVGMDGLACALAEAGLAGVPMRDPASAEAVGRCAAAVMGLDTRVTYQELARFCRHVSALGRFVLTNADPRLPVEDAFHPGNGALGALVTTTTGIEPVVIGKPSVRFVEFALRRFGARPEEAVIIGDNLATDIAAGRQAGVYAIQVLTGVPDARDDQGVWTPDARVASVADLLL